MSVLSSLYYGFLWVFYILRNIGYRQYRFMVFLSRPFAPHCLSSICFSIVMLTHYYTSGWPLLSDALSFEANAKILLVWLQYAEGKNLWKIIDVPLLVVGLFCQIPQIVFRRYTAIRGSVKKPLKPMRKVKPPKQKITVVSARLAVRPPKLHKGIKSYEMPVRVQALLDADSLI